eukprot:gene8937-biopygen22676
MVSGFVQGEMTAAADRARSGRVPGGTDLFPENNKKQTGTCGRVTVAAAGRFPPLEPWGEHDILAAPHGRGTGSGCSLGAGVARAWRYNVLRDSAMRAAARCAAPLAACAVLYGLQPTSALLGLELGAEFGARYTEKRLRVTYHKKACQSNECVLNPCVVLSLCVALR